MDMKGNPAGPTAGNNKQLDPYKDNQALELSQRYLRGFVRWLDEEMEKKPFLGCAAAKVKEAFPGIAEVWAPPGERRFVLTINGTEASERFQIALSYYHPEEAGRES